MKRGVNLQERVVELLHHVESFPVHGPGLIVVEDRRAPFFRWGLGSTRAAAIFDLLERVFGVVPAFSVDDEEVGDE